MSTDPDSQAPQPPTRRFGPVTLLASLGGLAMRLIAAVVAQTSRSPFSARGILVSFICIGVTAGIAAGIVVERPQLLPAWVRRLPGSRIPWHWFRFNLRFVIWVTTGFALYCGINVACLRWCGLTVPQYNLPMLIRQLYQIPLVIMYLMAMLAFINRRHVHPRVCRRWPLRDSRS